MAQLEQLTGTLKYDYDGSSLKGAMKDMHALGQSGESAGKSGGIGMLALKGGALAAGAAVAGVGIAAAGAAVGLASSVGKAMDFESGLSNIKAVSGATAEEMDKVKDAALRIGAETSFSASEGAAAIEELVKAGVSVEGVLNGAADAAVALAAAGEVDMPTAAAIAGAAMNNFGIAASELPHIADLIAGAANASAISVEDFGYSLQASGAAAALAGFSFDDLSVAVTAMGNAGIKGSDAGTSLKTFMMNLQPETDKQIGLFKELGLTLEDGSNAFFDAEGNVKSMTEVAGILKEATKDLTSEQKLSTLSTLFGSDAIRAAAVIAEEGAEGMTELAGAMGKVTAADVSATKLDNLSGSVEAFWGSLETLQIKAGMAFTPILKLLTDFATEGLNALMPMLDQITPLIEGFFSGIDVGAFFDDMFGGVDLGGMLSGLMGGGGLDLGGLIDPSALSGMADSIRGIGEAFMGAFSDPAVGEFLTNMWERLQDIGAFIIDPLLPISLRLSEAFAKQFAVALPVVLDIANALHENLWPIIESIFGFIRDNQGIIGDWLILTQAPLAAVYDLKAAWDDLGSVEMPDVGGWLGGLFGGGEAEAEAAGQESALAFAKGMTAAEAAAFAASAATASKSMGGLSAALDEAVGGWEPPDLDIGGWLQGMSAAIKGEEFFGAVLGDVGVPLDEARDSISGWLQGMGAAIKGEEFFGAVLGDIGVPLDEARDAIAGIQWPELPTIDLSALTDPFTDAWASIQSGIDSAWAEFDSTIQGAQDAIYSYLLDIWMQIPEDIREDLVLIADHILEQFEVYRQTIEDKLSEAKDAITGWLGEVQDAWNDWLAEILATATETWDDVKTAIMGPLTEAKTELSTAWASVEAEARAAWDRVRAAVVEKVEAAMSYLSGIRDQVAQRARDAWAGVVEAAHTALDPLVSAVTTKVEAALSYLTGVRDTVQGKAREIWDGFVEATRSALDRFKDVVITPIRSGIDNLKTAVTDAKNKALEIGRNIITGIVDALVAGKERLISAALAGVRGLLDAIKAFLGIASRSKVMYKIGRWTMEGWADGITDGGADVLSAMSSVTSGFLALITGDTEDGKISKAIADLADLSDEYERLQAIADQVNDSDPLAGPIRRMNEAMSVFFNSNAVGGLTDLLALMAKPVLPDGAGFSPNQASLLERLGFSERSFAEIQAAINELSGEPEKQAALWGDFIDGLTSAWDEFYRSQVGPLEDQKKALELLKKQYQRDPNRTGTELDPQIEAIQAQIDMWEARNEAINRGIDSHEMGLDGILAAYKRISEAVDATNEQAEAAWEAYERALKAAQDAVKARGAAAEDAEESAHDEVMAMLDAEERRRERAHKADMQALEDRRTKLEEVIAAENAAEEKAHADRMAAITREVDAADAINDAEEARLKRANLLIDTLRAGNALTAEQESFLRSLGIDPAQLIATNAGLAQTEQAIVTLQRRLDVLKGLADKLPDERGRVRQAGAGGVRTEFGDKKLGSFSDAERKVLEEGLASGAISEKDRRVVEVFLAGGVVQAQRLRDILAPLIKTDEDALVDAEKKVDLAKEEADQAGKILAAREAALKVLQDETATRRDALAPLLAAEEAAHEAWLKAQGERLTALDLEIDARKREHDAWKDAFDEAKLMEEERHDARMKAIRDEYALQLMMLGKTDAEIAAILDEQARRQAAISAEAEERWKKIMADAAALRTPVTGEVGGTRAPGIKEPGPIPVLPGDPGRGAKGGKPLGATPFEEFITGAPSMGQMMTELSAAMAPIITALPAITGTGGGGGGGNVGDRSLTNYGVIINGDQGNPEFSEALADFLGL